MSIHPNTHGWPVWISHVNEVIAEHRLQLRYIEIMVMQGRDAKSTPQISAWKELLQAAGALGTTLRWVFVILVVLGVIFKRIALSDLPFFKALGGG